jgi:Protein of unknown function (DUF3631)
MRATAPAGAASPSRPTAATAVMADGKPIPCHVCGRVECRDVACGRCPHCFRLIDELILVGHEPGCLNYVPDPYATATLLADTYAFLRRFLVADDSALVAGALWIAHTHAFDAADATPRLSIRSAEAESGKTRWLESLKLLVRGPIFMVGVSDAALFRLIEESGRTPLLDEIDTIFGPKARDREDLRGMLDAGYERGATVPRVEGEGSKRQVREFAVFAPVAFAGLGKLPYTLETRSIIVRMKPRTAGEHVERLRRRKVKPDADKLRERWEVWAQTHTSELAYAEPELPDELSDRAQDVWEPLLAIADHAGEDWPERARAAAVELHWKRGDDEESIGRRLLADIRAVLDDPERDDPVDEVHGQAITSGALATALATIEGAPWAEWGKDDKPITAHKVARMLGPFGIRPDQYKIAGRKIRGYLRYNFEDAWRRHLPQESGTDAKVVPPNASKGKGSTTFPAVPLSPGNGAGSDIAERLSALDPDDPDHGQRIAELRAEEVRRRRFTR